MLPLGARNVLRGMREGDTSRTTVGSLLLLLVFYRWARRRASLIARYEIREGDDLRIELPPERSVDAAARRAAIIAASAAADLDDDLLRPPSPEDEGEDRQDDDSDE